MSETLLVAALACMSCTIVLPLWLAEPVAEDIIPDMPPIIPPAVLFAGGVAVAGAGIAGFDRAGVVIGTGGDIDTLGMVVAPVDMVGAVGVDIPGVAGVDDIEDELSSLFLHPTNTAAHTTAAVINF